MPSEKNRVGIRLSDEMKAEVDAKAREYGVSTSAFITFIVGQYISNQKKVMPMFENMAKMMPEVMKALPKETLDKLGGEDQGKG